MGQDWNFYSSDTLSNYTPRFHCNINNPNRTDYADKVLLGANYRPEKSS